MKSSIPPRPSLISKLAVSKDSRMATSFLAPIIEKVRNESNPSNDDASMTGMESLLQLREKAFMRDKSRDLRAAEEMELKKIHDTKERIASLPTLCDALRSKCLGENRTCVKTSELIRNLISELCLSQIELSQRLLMISEIVPEFITVIPADDVVSTSTIRLNLRAPYAPIRRKVIDYAKWACQ